MKISKPQVGFIQLKAQSERNKKTNNKCFNNKFSNEESFSNLNLLNYQNIYFAGKAKKKAISPEQLAQIEKQKRLQRMAVVQRELTPYPLQIAFPLPAEKVKASHLNQINSNILNDSYIKEHPQFKNKLETIFSEKCEDIKPINEDDLLVKLLNASNVSKEALTVEDTSYTELLDNSFKNIPELDDLKIQEKALIALVAKTSGIDGGNIKKQVVLKYHDLINYAQENRAKLTEPVEETMGNEQINEYFQDNKAKIIVSLMTLGSHPLKQRLEQRLIKFDNTIDAANELFKGTELQAPLHKICIQLKERNSPAKTVRFFELTKALAEAGANNDELVQTLNEFVESKKIDIPKLGKLYLKSLQKNLSLNTGNNEKGALDGWDYNYINTIPAFIKKNSEWHTEQLKTLLNSSFSNTYMETIHDEKHDFGVANNVTKSQFMKNGLNYEKWLKYNKENSFKLQTKKEYLASNPQADISPDFKFPKQSENFAVRVWKRDPKQDLFQGSTAGQCIALDGVNSYAGVDELLYSYAQLIEVVNKDAQTPVGNACVFWIKNPETEEKALLIDSIGINAKYENNPQIRDSVFDYVKEFSKTVAGKPVKLFIGNQFNKLKIDDLSDVIDNSYKIIGSTSEHKSYLDAIIADDRIQRYVSIDPDKEFEMELRELK